MSSDNPVKSKIENRLEKVIANTPQSSECTISNQLAGERSGEMHFSSFVCLFLNPSITYNKR